MRAIYNCVLVNGFRKRFTFHSIRLNLHFYCFSDKLLHKQDGVEFTKGVVLCIISTGFHSVQREKMVGVLARTHDTHKVTW